MELIHHCQRLIVSLLPVVHHNQQHPGVRRGGLAFFGRSLELFDAGNPDRPRECLKAKAEVE